MGNESIKCITILFSTPLSHPMIPKFRGAIISHLEDELGESDVLFHNHIENSFRWSYPLIQYKSIDGKAAIVCLSEGLSKLVNLFSSLEKPVLIGKKAITLKVDSIVPQTIFLSPMASPASYRLSCWLPLNSENYRRFEGIESIKDKTVFLERILTGNILSMAKGLGIQIPFEISCTITDFTRSYLIESKDIKMNAYDISFNANILLPDYIGLGKHVSTGFGIIKRNNHNSI